MKKIMCCCIHIKNIKTVCRNQVIVCVKTEVVALFCVQGTSETDSFCLQQLLLLSTELIYTRAIHQNKQFSTLIIIVSFIVGLLNLVLTNVK